MAYTPTNWVDATTPVNAANLNKMETELAALDAVISGGVASIAYKGDWAAGTYQDGDTVVKDGVVFLCAGGPTAVSPDATLWGSVGGGIPPLSEGKWLKVQGGAMMWADADTALGQRLAPQAPIVTDCNNAIENGWYMTVPTTLNAGSLGYGFIRVERPSDTWVHQWGYSYGTAYSPSTLMYRYYNGTVWSGWGVTPGGGPQVVRVRKTANVGLGTGGANVTFDLEDKDDWGGHSTASLTERVNANGAGTYQVGAQAGFGSATGSYQAVLWARRYNSAAVLQEQFMLNSNGIGWYGNQPMGGSVLLLAAAGDFFTCCVDGGSDGAGGQASNITLTVVKVA